MDNNENKFIDFFSKIFSEFTLIESGLQKLISYSKTLKGNQKENLEHIVLLKELALKKIKGGIIDEDAVNELIKEVDKILNGNNNRHQNNNKIIKSFNDIDTTNYFTFDEEMINCKFIFSNCIIYLDSIKDYNFQNKIFSDAIDKPKIFQTHYNLLNYFLLENPKYKSVFQNKQNAIEITTIGSLQGLDSEHEVTVFGMLLINENNQIQLQDLTHIVTLDISNIIDWGIGYFCNGCCVLCQGLFKNNILKCKLIMHPPPVWNVKKFEDKYEKDFFGTVLKAFKYGSADSEIIQKNKEIISNNLNNNPETKISNDKKFQQIFLHSFLEPDLSLTKIIYPKCTDKVIDINNIIKSMKNSHYESNIVNNYFQNSYDILSNEFFLVISNPDLTDQKVLDAIDKIIASFISTKNEKVKIPFMIIFMGNFIKEQSYNQFKLINLGFDNLTNILLKNSFLSKNCYFVFMSGPGDPSLYNGFPKFPFMPNIIQKMKKKIPNIINATNPCRFSIFGKDFVFFRDDLTKKISRNTINLFDKDIDQKQYFMHTIISQGSLSPCSLDVTSRIWHLANSMIMLPLPDALIIGDVVDDYDYKFEDLLFINTGNFSKDYSFYLVYPTKCICEGCKVTF